MCMALSFPLLEEKYYSGFKQLLFYKSGRSALAALFQTLKQPGRPTTILMPDYICNVVTAAAQAEGMVTQTYRTDSLFHPDLQDLTAKMEHDDVAFILFASIFGAQNNSSELIDWVFSQRPDLFIVLDECQNLISDVKLPAHSQVAVVLSFNNKTVEGVMGGVLCLFDDLPLHEPVNFGRIYWLHELKMWAMFLKQISRRVLNFYSHLRKRARYPEPKLEYSRCVDLAYDVNVQAAAKLSLIRAWLGLRQMEFVEERRSQNYGVLKNFVENSQLGKVIETDKVQYAPFIPLQSVDKRLFGRLPLKGPYTIHENPDCSYRSKQISIINNFL
jgi:hypothetical protein